jgi:hypothetical protein
MPPELRVRRRPGFTGGPVIEAHGARSADDPVFSWTSFSKAMNAYLTERDGEWCGIPMPLPGAGLVLEDRHPHKARTAEMQRIIDDEEPVGDETPLGLRADTEGWRVVNSWRGRTPEGVTGEVLVLRHEDGRVRGGIVPDAMGRNKHMLGALSTLDAWDLDTECAAMEKLATLLTERMFKAYVCTGSFLETSKRSGLTYLFRRLRPTVVMTPRSGRLQHDPKKDLGMAILACLCLHPLAYYRETMCGAMCPTDDVIAHLMLMRGDEHLYWRRANQHHPLSPNSGLGI